MSSIQNSEWEVFYVNWISGPCEKHIKVRSLCKVENFLQRLVLISKKHSAKIRALQNPLMSFMNRLIIVKGFQVAPAELEDLLRQHPKIQDVAVIGIPHEKYGEVPRYNFK